MAKATPVETADVVVPEVAPEVAPVAPEVAPVAPAVEVEDDPVLARNRQAF